jgi:Lon protease-like protein
MSDHADQVPEAPEPTAITVDDRLPAIPAELPVLPLRDTVLFPNSFMPLAVARESSVRLIDEAIANGKLIGVFTQRDPALDEPLQADLYPVGTATHIHKMFRLPDGSLRLIVQGLSRIRLDEIVSLKPYLRASITAIADEQRDEDLLEIDALLRNIKSSFQKVVSLSPLLSDDLQTLAINIEEPGRLADFIASSLSTITTATKQEVLDTLDVRARMDNLNRILIKELEVLELGSKIQSQVQSEVGKNQREYFLREQLKAIQKELGEGDEQTKDVEELKERLEAANLPEAVMKEAMRELDRPSKMPASAAELPAGVTSPVSRVLTAGVDYQAAISTDMDSADKMIRVTPLKPLRPSQGSVNIGYMLYLMNVVHDVDGNAVQPSGTYASYKSAPEYFSAGGKSFAHLVDVLRHHELPNRDCGRHVHNAVRGYRDIARTLARPSDTGSREQPGQVAFEQGLVPARNETRGVPGQVGELYDEARKA